MSGHLVPGDHAFHEDKQLVADLATLNEQLSRYMVRYLAADALRADAISVTEERRLAQTMAALASKVHERANRRAVLNAPTLEGDAALRHQISGRPSERC